MLNGSSIEGQEDNTTLPIPREIRRDALAHGESGDKRRLIAIADAPVILTPNPYGCGGLRRLPTTAGLTP